MAPLARRGRARGLGMREVFRGVRRAEYGSGHEKGGGSETECSIY
jgi:hypothetical protein